MKIPIAGGQVPRQIVAPASAMALAIAKPNPPSSATPATKARFPVRSIFSMVVPSVEARSQSVPVSPQSSSLSLTPCALLTTPRLHVGRQQRRAKISGRPPAQGSQRLEGAPRPDSVSGHQSRYDQTIAKLLRRKPALAIQRRGLEWLGGFHRLGEVPPAHSVAEIDDRVDLGGSPVTIEIAIDLAIELRIGIARRTAVAVPLDVGHPLHPDSPVARRFGCGQGREPGSLAGQRCHLPVVVGNSIGRDIGGR